MRYQVNLHKPFLQGLFNTMTPAKHRAIFRVLKKSQTEARFEATIIYEGVENNAFDFSIQNFKCFF